MTTHRSDQSAQTQTSPEMESAPLFSPELRRESLEILRDLGMDEASIVAYFRLQPMNPAQAGPETT